MTLNIISTRRMRYIAKALRAGDLRGYQRARYPHIQEGEPVCFYGEDFRGVDFSDFPLGFFEFFHCALDGSRGYSGQPITIDGCSARNIDLRGTSTVIYGVNTDFTGMRYDKDTEVAASSDDAVSSSVFVQCTFDQATRRYFEQQGATVVP